MTSTVQCDFCPSPYLGFLFASPGISDESVKLRQHSIDSQRRELLRADESCFSRVNDVRTKLIEIYRDCHKADWNGREAAAIPYAAIVEAEQLIAQIPERYPMPDIFPESTGEVGFEWYIDPYRVLLLSVAGDGYIYYAGLYGFKDADHGSKQLTGKLNKKIFALLDELYEDAEDVA